MDDNPIFLDKKMVICICPRCRRLHKKGINWQGRGVPRINCRECSKLQVMAAETVFPDPKKTNRVEYY